MKSAPIRHAAEYAAFLLVKGCVRALPHPAARALGSSFGSLAHALDGRHHRVALRNLELAFPERDQAWRRATARDCFRHFGATLFDTLSGQRFDAVELCRRLTLEGWEHWHTAKDAGRGVLVMGAHLGNWEAVSPALALYAGDLHILGRPADNPWLDREVRRVRERFGNRTISKHGAARPMLRALHSHHNVALLIDQRVRAEEGVRVPFFGRDAATSPVLARLSLRTGAPVVPVFGFPEARGGWRVKLHPPIWPTGSGEEAVLDLTASYLGAVEREVRERPEQWLWLHDRWRENGRTAS